MYIFDEFHQFSCNFLRIRGIYKWPTAQHTLTPNLSANLIWMGVSLNVVSIRFIFDENLFLPVCGSCFNVFSFIIIIKTDGTENYRKRLSTIQNYTRMFIVISKTFFFYLFLIVENVNECYNTILRYRASIIKHTIVLQIIKPYAF